MSSISFRLPDGWKRSNCQTIDEALVAKRCKDLVKDVASALENYSDSLASRDNGDDDYCPDANHVIALKQSDRNGYCVSDVDLSYSDDRGHLVRGEIRSTAEGYSVTSKAEPCSDGTTTFTRVIDFTDDNGTRNEQNISVQMNAEGTLSILSDQGNVPANLSYYVKNIHVPSKG